MTTRIKIKHGWNGLRFGLLFVLLCFYLAVGFSFIFSDIWKDFLPSGRPMIGIVLILFGILRFYVGYRRFRNKRERIHARHAASQKAKQTDNEQKES